MHDPSKTSGNECPSSSNPAGNENASTEDTNQNVIDYSMLLQYFGDSETDDFTPTMVENNVDADMVENDVDMVENGIDMDIERTNLGKAKNNDSNGCLSF